MSSRAEVSEFEIQAYIDGELSPARRAEVARHIEADPQLAARILADLRIRDDLRSLFHAQTLAGTTLSGRRSSFPARRFSRFASIAAAGMMAVGGWVASDQWDLRGNGRAEAHTPDFPIDAAVMSHKTALVRSRLYLDSRPRLDAAGVKRETRIAVPELPPNWRVLDVQLFPSKVGPSMQLTLDDGPGPPISLFAVRARTSAPAEPETVVHDGEAVAYWQEGDLAFALTGQESPETMDAVAEDLADNSLIGPAR